MVFDSQLLIDRRLGPYRVLYEIGGGGRGTVYLALRADDRFEKPVAVKVVKRSMDSEEVFSRFRHERQVLADFDHSYIARLLDAGTTSDGRQFFILESVDGQSINVYCRKKRRNPAACWLLFLRVCEAVSYAHRNLVVHRDLKPANLLVGLDHAGAFDFAHRAVARAEAFANADRTNYIWAAHLARTYAEFAGVHRASTRRAAQRAVELWALIQKAGVMFIHRQANRDAQAFLTGASALAPR